MSIYSLTYTPQRLKTIALICIVTALIINSIYFGGGYYSNPLFFGIASLITFLELALVSLVCTTVSPLIRRRFPKEEQVIKKLSLMIVTFMLVTFFFKYLLFKAYAALPYFQTEFNESRLAWVYLSISIIIIFLTFLMESIYRFNAWKRTLEDTELLNTSYKQSQLNALKSQVNPHFLFNCLNSLSSLIEEDEEKAEDFLNELTKVYRYLLRNDHEHLVRLHTELDFLNAYIHLLRKRFGTGLQIHISIHEKDRSWYIPPLLLQVITENACAQHIISKQQPLVIRIESAGHHILRVVYNLQPKTFSKDMDHDTALNTMIMKYKLLGLELLIVKNQDGQQHISIPLIVEKKETAP
ncbi:sensor histidine kinase [Niabella drilacis]|uniref:Histidine kinase n=1 Tax=Niabella drilacis (strain DSM 25811 / CCM 8410 / CCUG 62505 / LMG 26954 / E90) TaxID=1285928 RepID=A0A1G6Z7D1_NIADE|nr:histidine kinase [Niabella drilacis]SDD98372.1 Histidine kinase [Niabella drilacis]